MVAKTKLKNRQMEMLRCLIASGVPLDISTLSEKFNRSERTVHNDLNIIRKSIAEYGVEIKNKPKKGFYIPAAQKPQCFKIVAQTSPVEEYSLLHDTSEIRFNTLFLYLICQRAPVSIDKIAQAFYVSRSTALRITNGFSENFKTQFRLISQKNGEYEIAGSEPAIRHYAGGILVNLFDGSYTNEDWYMLLPEVLKKEIKLQNIINISSAIKRMNAKYNVWISNHAFLNLLSYCIIRDIRIYKKSPMEKEEETILQRNGELEYAVSLLAELSSAHSGYRHSEISWLLDVLNSNGILVNQESETETELEKVVSDMVAQLKYSKWIKSYDFDIETLTRDLYEHIRRYLKMVKIENEPTEKLLLEEIHNKYEDFYFLANDCVEVFTRHYEITLPKPEICYIAVYLYKNLTSKITREKRVLVVCATGKGLSNLLTTRIKNVFHNIIVIDQVSPYQLDPKYIPDNVDFIISTIPIGSCVLPVVKISTVLSKEDIKRIQEFINYGSLIDSIPLNQENAASFSSKTDPFDLYDITIDTQKTDLSLASVLLSKLIMTLIEYLSKLPKQYQLSPDSILGVMIHLSMAIPRWYQGSQAEDTRQTLQRYHDIKQMHYSVYVLMEKFFRLVEDVLLVSIPVSERYSFFLYIINYEEEENEKVID